MLLLPTIPAIAQNEKTQSALAQQYLENKNYEKAIPIFKALYESAPFDKNLYDQYLDALLKADQNQKAEELVVYMMKIRRGDPAMLVDLGIVYESENKKRAAKNTFRQTIDQINGNEFKIKALADAFEKYSKEEYAAEVYEQARKINRNPYLYASQLSYLYTKLGNTKLAIAATLDLAMTQQHILDDVKISLAQIINKDKNGFSLIQKELEQRIKEQSNNPFWKELYFWLYIQKGDYEGAYKGLIDLDKKLNEDGKRLLPFADECAKNNQFETAIKSYNYILQKGKEAPYYTLAFQGKLVALLAQFQNNRPQSKSDLSQLLNQYNQFFQEFPTFKTTELWRNYAMVQARYNSRADTAISMLQEAIRLSGEYDESNDFVGRCKLDMGDYKVLIGKVWDATLLYAQVDKTFKEDYLGEQARFKNAKLAYYRGDFEWAQNQLTVLKASTTKLIANDALYLSVLITENTPPDSNMIPLLRFAAADLLLFQHKTRASDQLLDSIAKAFPQTPLQDDIDMLRAKIAIEEHRWQDAVLFLEDIIKKYSTDILGDDAAYKLALIYRDHLHDNKKALSFFEKLLINYPGSTYIQEARIAIRALKQQ